MLAKVILSVPFLIFAASLTLSVIYGLKMQKLNDKSLLTDEETKEKKTVGIVFGVFTGLMFLMAGIIGTGVYYKFKTPLTPEQEYQTNMNRALGTNVKTEPSKNYGTLLPLKK
jgi:hypothetical protein